MLRKNGELLGSLVLALLFYKAKKTIAALMKDADGGLKFSPRSPTSSQRHRALRVDSNLKSTFLLRKPWSSMVNPSRSGYSAARRDDSYNPTFFSLQPCPARGSAKVVLGSLQHMSEIVYLSTFNRCKLFLIFVQSTKDLLFGRICSTPDSKILISRGLSGFLFST